MYTEFFTLSKWKSTCRVEISKYRRWVGKSLEFNSLNYTWNIFYLIAYPIFHSVSLTISTFAHCHSRFLPFTLSSVKLSMYWRSGAVFFMTVSGFLFTGKSTEIRLTVPFTSGSESNRMCVDNETHKQVNKHQWSRIWSNKSNLTAYFKP